jgi:hypothetical protein
MMKDISVELAEWLKQRGATIDVYVAGPKGGSVPPDTFIPAGWTIQVVALAPEVKQNAGPYTSLAE